MFNWLFNNKTLSKTEYWKKWEFFEILEDLHEAEIILERKINDDEFFSETKEFHLALIEEIDNIEEGNKNDLSQIWEWFGPNKNWNYLTSSDGQELGQKIFQRADKWKNACT